MGLGRGKFALFWPVWGGGGGGGGGLGLLMRIGAYFDLCGVFACGVGEKSVALPF